METLLQLCQRLLEVCASGRRGVGSGDRQRLQLGQIFQVPQALVGDLRIDEPQFAKVAQI